MKVENWIKWDLDSRTGWRMAGFFAEYGVLGYGAFMVFIELLYRAEGYKLSLDTNAYKSYTKLFKVEQKELEEILDALITCGLFEKDATHFWSRRVWQEIEQRNSKSSALSKKRQLAVNTRWNKEKQVDGSIQNDTNGIQNDTNDTRLDKIRVDKSSNSISMSNDGDPPQEAPTKKKGSKGDKYRNYEACDFKFPRLWAEQARQALEKWVKYKDNSGTAKLLISYQEEVDLYHDRPRVFVDLVHRAIAEQWQGLNAQIPLKQPQGANANGAKGQWKSISEKQVEKNMEILNEIREREKTEEEMENEAR